MINTFFDILEKIFIPFDILFSFALLILLRKGNRVRYPFLVLSVFPFFWVLFSRVLITIKTPRYAAFLLLPMLIGCGFLFAESWKRIDVQGISSWNIHFSFYRFFIIIIAVAIPSLCLYKDLNHDPYNGAYLRVAEMIQQGHKTWPVWISSKEKDGILGREILPESQLRIIYGEVDYHHPDYYKLLGFYIRKRQYALTPEYFMIEEYSNAAPLTETSIHLLPNVRLKRVMSTWINKRKKRMISLYILYPCSSKGELELNKNSVDRLENDGDFIRVYPAKQNQSLINAARTFYSRNEIEFPKGWSLFAIQKQEPEGEGPFLYVGKADAGQTSNVLNISAPFAFTLGSTRFLSFRHYELEFEIESQDNGEIEIGLQKFGSAKEYLGTVTMIDIPFHTGSRQTIQIKLAPEMETEPSEYITLQLVFPKGTYRISDIHLYDWTNNENHNGEALP